MIIDRPKTKIVCTLGPASSDEATIEALIQQGMSIARLNFSHGSIDSHIEVMERVRLVSKRLGIPVAIMVDVPGAKYRTGQMKLSALHLDTGKLITLSSKARSTSQDYVNIAPHGIELDVEVGTRILLDDGLIELEVQEVGAQGAVCRGVVGGVLTEGRGVSVPGQVPRQPFPGDKGMEALEFAAGYRADLVALAMVYLREHVDTARTILEAHGHVPFLISKIELEQAISNFDELLDASDGIMVARGDMGVEVELARVPIIQKNLISSCNKSGKPVITATQMLESMIHLRTPTRAEVTDVANAIYDGSDAIMLSGETATGDYPVDAVKVMAEVALEAEAALPYANLIEERGHYRETNISDAISYGACQTASQLNLELIVAFTEAGSTAGRVSRYRPNAPVLALTPSEAVQRRLLIWWAVTPVVVEKIETVEKFFDLAEKAAKDFAGAQAGTDIVLVAGLPIGVPGGTNLLRVLTVS